MTKWNLKEINFLQNNFQDLSYIEISKKLNRSISSIYWKAFELKLKKGRWNENNRLNKNKIIGLLIKEKERLGRSPSIREIPISLKSACQRHFGSFNKAKKAAKLKIKNHIKLFPKRAYKPSNELAYIVGLFLGDGNLRIQKTKNRTSYVLSFTTKDKDLMNYFIYQFKKWSGYIPEIAIRKEGYRKFPNGNVSYFNKTYNIQFCSKEALCILKKFFDKPLICLNFFEKKDYNWIIKGLWDAEGCIRIYHNSLRIHFSNSSKKIIKLYTKLVKKFNIPFSIHKNGCVFNVDILGRKEKNKFIKIIKGITIKRKRDLLKKINNKSPDFSQKVYRLLKEIPCGYVSTYSEVAKALDTKAYRAVGNALNKNKFPEVYPCYKIINSNGNLGGYSEGLKLKIKKLKQDRIKIENSKINLKKYLFKFK